MASLLYELISVLLLALSSAVLVQTLVFNGASSASVYALTLLSSILTVLPLHLKRRGRIILAGIAAAAVAGVILSAEPDARMEFVREHLWVGAVFLGCAAAALFVKAGERTPNLKWIPVIGGTAFLLLVMVQGIPIGKIPVLVVLFLIVVSIIELLQAGWKKEGDTDAKKHVLFTLPIIGTVFVLLSFLNFPAKPYDWKFVKDLSRDLRSRYELLKEMAEKKDGFEEDAEVGFSETSYFFGHLRRSSYQVFEIVSPLPRGERVYLSGKTFDHFDGRCWKKRDDGSENYSIYDILETSAAVTAFDEEHAGNYLRSGTLEITGTGMRSAHVFSPLKTLPNIHNAETEEIGGDLLFKGQRRMNCQVVYYRLNRGYKGLEELLKENRRMNEETFQKVKAMLAEENRSGISYAEYKALQERIHLVYGEKPELSSLMRQYLEEITEGAESDYEKLVRIKSSLCEMRYTTDPGPLPESVHSEDAFLQYLLLDKQEGYCTHYATAFVLLSRALGIPARYVQGYCFTLEEGSTEVLSDCAHAWPQAYLDGFGWIDFEPSPGCERLSGWAVKSEEERAEETGDHSIYPENHSGSEGKEERDEAEERKASSLDYPSLLSPLLLAGLFVLLFIPADYAYRKVRYARMGEKEKVNFRYKAIMKLLKRMGFVIFEGETLSEFENRIKSSIPEEYLRFIGRYEDIIYGEKSVSEADTAYFERAEKEIRGLWLRRFTGRKKSG